MPKGEQGAGSRGGGKAGKPTAYQVQKYNKGETINIRKEEAIRTRLARLVAKAPNVAQLSVLPHATPRTPLTTARPVAWPLGRLVGRFVGSLVCWFVG